MDCELKQTSESNEIYLSQKHYKLATASRTLGILSICSLLFALFAIRPTFEFGYIGAMPFILMTPFIAIPSVIMGKIALRRLDATPSQAGNRKRAIAGIYLGGASLSIGIVSIIVFGVLFFVQAREAALRKSCQNNFKQIGKILQDYLAEQKNNYFPELSPIAGMLMFSKKDLFPKYMPDPSILHCPRQQNPYPGRVASENWFDDDSYTYLGYIITNDEELEAFVNVYKVRIAQGLPFNCDLDAPPGLGSSHSDKFVRLQKDINRYITPLIGFPGGGSNSNVESLPIMWDNLQLKPCENTPSSNHSPIGSNVLFYDGHVAFLKYPGNFPVSEKSIILLSELRALRVSP